MKKNSEIRDENLRALVSQHGLKNLSVMLGHASPSTISQLYNKSKDSKTGKEKNIGDVMARRIEKALNLPQGWMDTAADQTSKLFAVSKTPIILESKPNASDSNFELTQGDVDSIGAYEIMYLDARGSCGGGSTIDAQPKGKLIKEASFFVKYQLKPENAVVVFADGDSMADYICDGDMVIFDRSKTTPRSGKIFLITHPDGLRIKQLRREIDGTWVLESRNQDKRSYPDERLPATMADMLKIEGEFVYRQGG